MNCNHKNAYVIDKSYDTYEGRKYDECFCPNCMTYFDSRVIMGKHKYPKLNKETFKLEKL